VKALEIPCFSRYCMHTLPGVNRRSAWRWWNRVVRSERALHFLIV